MSQEEEGEEGAGYISDDSSLSSSSSSCSSSSSGKRDSISKSIINALDGPTAQLDLNSFDKMVRVALNKESSKIKKEQKEKEKQKQREEKAKEREKRKRKREADERLKKRKKMKHTMVTRAQVPDLVSKTKLTKDERKVLVDRFGMNRCRRCLKLKDKECFYKKTPKEYNDCGYRRTCIECENDSFNQRPNRKAFGDLIRSCRSRAAEKGLEFDISAKDLEMIYNLQDGKCNYTGRKLKIKSERTHTKRMERNREARIKSNSNKTYHRMDKASVDRIDPNGGYTRDNVHLVRVHVNYAKLDMQEDDFISMCRDVVTKADERTGPTIAPLMEQDESSDSPSLVPSHEEPSPE